jgi:hypothetical protein
LFPSKTRNHDQALASTDKAEHAPFDLAGMFDFDSRHGAERLFLNPTTGQPVDAGGH